MFHIFNISFQVLVSKAAQASESNVSGQTEAQERNISIWVSSAPFNFNTEAQNRAHPSVQDSSVQLATDKYSADVFNGNTADRTFKS